MPGSFPSLVVFVRRTVLPLLVSVAVLAVAGCSGSSTGTDAEVASPSEDGPQSLENIDFQSPLGDLLGYGFDRDEDFEARIMEEQRESELLIAECMQAKGFQHVPRDPAEFTFFGSPDGLAYGSDEWVERYGFGVTTQMFPQSEVGDLVGFPDQNLPELGDFVDPNQEYLDALSDGERDAYYEALYGPPMEFEESADGSSGPPPQMFEPQGCQGEGMTASGSGPGDEQAFYEEFGSQLEALNERVESDPRIVQFNDRVSSCMAERGLAWTGQEDIYERWQPELEALQPDFGPEDPFEAAGLDPENMSDEEVNDFFTELQRLSPAQLDDLARLQTEELELARAVQDCGGGQLDQAVLYNEVRVEYEQDFVDANADALAEFAAD